MLIVLTSLHARPRPPLQRRPPDRSPGEEDPPQVQSSSAGEGAERSGPGVQVPPHGRLEGFLHSRYQHGALSVRRAGGGVLRTTGPHISSHRWSPSYPDLEFPCLDVSDLYYANISLRCTYQGLSQTW